MWTTGSADQCVPDSSVGLAIRQTVNNTYRRLYCSWVSGLDFLCVAAESESVGVGSETGTPGSIDQLYKREIKAQ